MDMSGDRESDSAQCRHADAVSPEFTSEVAGQRAAMRVGKNGKSAIEKHHR